MTAHRPYRDFLERPGFTYILLSVLGALIIGVMVALFWEYQVGRIEHLQDEGIRVTGYITQKVIRRTSQNDTRIISGHINLPENVLAPFQVEVSEDDYDRLMLNQNVGLIHDPTTTQIIELQSFIDGWDTVEFRRMMPLRYLALAAFLLVVGVLLWLGEAFVKYRRQDETA